jgi:hypothetical protein
MDERLREFAKQAGLDAILDQHAHEYGNGTLANTSYPEVAKFAELIVQECIGCVRGAGLANNVAVRNKLEFNDGISEAVTHIKKHFGVES